MVGTATAEGVYARRELKGLTSAVQFEDPALSVGTKALLRQSSIAARRYKEKALLKVADRVRRMKTRNLTAILLSNIASVDTNQLSHQWVA